jgi:E3 ubiquitin-protein ligase RGLG
MGGNPSKSSPRDGDGRYGRSSSFPQPPHYYGQGAQSGYYDQDPPTGYYAAPTPAGGYAAPYQAPPAAAPEPQPAPRPRLDRRYSRIADEYNSVEQVRFALRLSRWQVVIVAAATGCD